MGCGASKTGISRVSEGQHIKSNNAPVPRLHLTTSKLIKAKKQEETNAIQKVLLEFPELQEALVTAQEIMKEMNRMKDDDFSKKTMNIAVTELLDELHDLYFEQEDEEHRKILSDEVAGNNAGHIFTEYIRVLTCDGTKTPTDPQGYEAQCLHLLWATCLNYSNSSLAMCGLRQKGPHKASDEGYVYVQGYLDREKRVVSSVIGVLYNCAKAIDNKKYYKEAKAVEALLPYTKSKSQDYLRNATASDTHEYDGYSAEELVSGLMHLARNGDNSSTIVKAGILPIMVKLMKEGSDSEKEISAKTVWVLTFNSENKEKILEEEGMEEILKKISEGPDELAKSAASGALWVLGSDGRIDALKNKSDLKRLSSREGEEDRTKHVMVSYQWDCQKLMIKVKNKLEEAGYHVWIDIESMEGSTLKTMAEAVENSEVMLMSLSPKYKESPSCQTEAEYAYKLGKPIIPLRIEQSYQPDGWLGAIVGTKLYHDFSSHIVFESSMEKLMKELGDRGKITADFETIMQSVSRPAKARKIPPSQWTKSDVAVWAGRHGIISKKVLKLDGTSLELLSVLKHEAPEFFYKYLAEKLGVSNLRDIHKVREGLENLCLLEEV